MRTSLVRSIKIQVYSGSITPIFSLFCQEGDGEGRKFENLRISTSGPGEASINLLFIVSYESHFQTRLELCLVMKYMRLYLSDILLSLEYLHHLGPTETSSWKIFCSTYITNYNFTVYPVSTEYDDNVRL